MIDAARTLYRYCLNWAASARDYKDTGDEWKTIERMVNKLEVEAEKRGFERATKVVKDRTAYWKEHAPRRHTVTETADDMVRLLEAEK